VGTSYFYFDFALCSNYGLREKMSLHFDEDKLGESVDFAVMVCADSSRRGGWDEGIDYTNPYIVGTKLMLVVSEVAEAMEGHRKGLMDDKLPDRPMVEVELADAVIRIFHLADVLGFGDTFAQTLVRKVNYNDVRADHKPENRAKAGGKRY
jgi:NTP pyrophosphatase (non-canonical NTP hydrolase)